MRRIIDYIQFNTEVDLLEYRLNLLDHVIDYFIVVESEYTFSGIKKNFQFQKYSKRFARFENKIIQVQIQDVPHTSFVQDGKQWENEIHQRDMGLVTGLEKLQKQGVHLNDDDLVVISDCDEILDPRTIQDLKENQSFQEQILALEMDMYYYDFRRRHKSKWYHTKVAPIGVIKSGRTAHQIRHSQGQTVNRGGWHLSYFGDVSNIKRKLMDFSHQEFNNDKFQNIDHIKNAMMNGLDLFDRESIEFELNDFTYMPLDWRGLRVEGVAPLPDLGIREQIYGNHQIYQNVKEVEKNLQGWASYSPAFEAVIAKLKPSLIIEVGTWKGASTIHMSRLCQKYCKDFEIICIDTFLGSFENWLNKKEDYISDILVNGRPKLYEIFLSNIVSEQLQNHVIPLPMDSTNSALTLTSLGIQADLVYVDAGHSYESVVRDLYMYKELVKHGGYLLGDDWFHPPIKRAVREALGDVETLSADKFLWRRE